MNTEFNKDIPCLWKNHSECDSCDLDGTIHCKLDGKITLKFGIPAILSFIPSAIGVIFLPNPLSWITGVIWISYIIFFFLIWEPRILCSHCPFYPEPGNKILHCSINYGFLKTSKFKPYPLKRTEKIQFITGGLLLYFFPLPIIIFSGQVFIALIQVMIFFPSIIFINRYVCSCCINISCPLNRLSKDQRIKFLNLNPKLKDRYQNYF